MAVGDLLKLTVNVNVTSTQMQNVLYYEVAEDDTLTNNAVELILQFAASVIPFWGTAISLLAFIECIEVQKVFPSPVLRSFLGTIGLFGSVSGEPLPATVGALYRKTNSVVTGRGKSGRMYLGGLTETQQNNGRITTAAKVPLEALATELEKTLLSTNGGQYRPAWAVRAPTPSAPITGLVIAEEIRLLPRLANQRRRRTPVQSFA